MPDDDCLSIKFDVILSVREGSRRGIEEQRFFTAVQNGNDREERPERAEI